MIKFGINIKNKLLFQYCLRLIGRLVYSFLTIVLSIQYTSQSLYKYFIIQDMFIFFLYIAIRWASTEQYTHYCNYNYHHMLNAYQCIPYNIILCIYYSGLLGFALLAAAIDSVTVEYFNIVGNNIGQKTRKSHLLKFQLFILIITSTFYFKPESYICDGDNCTGLLHNKYALHADTTYEKYKHKLFFNSIT